jgi:hypothetical protein
VWNVDRGLQCRTVRVITGTKKETKKQKNTDKKNTDKKTRQKNTDGRPEK